MAPERAGGCAAVEARQAEAREAEAPSGGASRESNSGRPSGKGEEVGEPRRVESRVEWSGVGAALVEFS